MRPSGSVYNNSHVSHLYVYPSRKSSAQSEIEKDDSLMQYAVKGSDAQWNKMIGDREVDESGTIQIQSVRPKRKALDDEDFDKEGETEKLLKKTKSPKGGKKKNKGKK
jgi:hypothetical protein